jgi:hypothetical protein
VACVRVPHLQVGNLSSQVLRVGGAEVRALQKWGVAQEVWAGGFQEGTQPRIRDLAHHRGHSKHARTQDCRPPKSTIGMEQLVYHEDKRVQ